VTEKKVIGLSLTDAIARANAVIDVARNEVQKRTAPKETRMILAGAAWVLSLEHHRAIVVLMRAGLYGSVMALRRTQYEAFASAMWLMHIATEQQLGEFSRGRCKPGLSALDRSVREKIGLPNGQGAQEWMKELHDYAHAGTSAVAQQLGPAGIQPRYQEQDLVHRLDMANALAAASILEIVGHATNDEAVVREIQRRLMAIMKEAP
jgi:hypothetical protein